MKEIWIYACVAIASTGIIIANIASSERRAEQPTVEQPTIEKPIEHVVETGRIKCAKESAVVGLCDEWIIYNVVKE